MGLVGRSTTKGRLLPEFDLTTDDAGFEQHPVGAHVHINEGYGLPVDDQTAREGHGGEYFDGAVEVLAQMTETSPMRVRLLATGRELYLLDPLMSRKTAYLPDRSPTGHAQGLLCVRDEGDCPGPCSEPVLLAGLDAAEKHP